MAGEDPTISTLHYIGGSNLFLLMGTSTGTIWAVPMSIKSKEDLVIVKDTSHQGAAVSYIRIFGGNLFVSWDDGWLCVYAIQNLSSFLEMAKINRSISKKGINSLEVIAIGM